MGVDEGFGGREKCVGRRRFAVFCRAVVVDHFHTSQIPGYPSCEPQWCSQALFLEIFVGAAGICRRRPAFRRALGVAQSPQSHLRLRRTWKELGGVGGGRRRAILGSSRCYFVLTGAPGAPMGGSADHAPKTGRMYRRGRAGKMEVFRVLVLHHTGSQPRGAGIWA